VQPPPAFSWTPSLWTFVGVLSTLLILTKINTLLVQNFGPEHSIVLGPFGALVTFDVGLTAAPASQPRNALLGQGISIAIAIGISKTPLEDWLKQSLATALAVTTMVKVGVTHPPAGAAAHLFSTGKYGWLNMLAVMLANLASERQYPTFWGFQHYYRMMSQHQVRACKQKGDKKEELAQESSKLA